MASGELFGTGGKGNGGCGGCGQQNAKGQRDEYFDEGEAGIVFRKEYIHGWNTKLLWHGNSDGFNLVFGRSIFVSRISEETV